MSFLIAIYRTIFFYFFVIVSYRIMGKREVGELGVIDLIVSLLIAELIAISIENLNKSMFYTILPIAVLVVLEVLLAYISMKSKKIRVLLSGKPSIIIANGKINYNEMVKQRYSLDDLLITLRLNKIKSIEDVEYAFLESNGKLSIFKYDYLKRSSSYPMPLILDGKVQIKTLKYINKDNKWLDYYLNRNNINLDNVFYCFYKKNRLFVIKKDELK